MASLYSIILGGLFWTFMEYMLHRFLGHVIPKNKFYIEHQKHHHLKDYFVSAWIKAISCLAFGAPVALISIFIAGPRIGGFFTTGFLSMYLYYEWYHRHLHVAPPKGFLSSLLRSHHFYHHFGNENLNHGVTSPIWDIVFRTYHPSKKIVISVPKKFKMDWLIPSVLFTDRNGTKYIQE